MKPKGYKTPSQVRALRRKTSYGIRFVRSKAIEQVKNSSGDWVSARSPGKEKVTSLRRFGSEAEAKHHGKRFKRLEGHLSFEVLLVKKSPNAFVNWRTGRTNPVIAQKRTNRR